MMDETELYSDDIPPYTWVEDEDKEAYVVSSGTQRLDTLVYTIRGDGEGFSSFIKHRNMKTRMVNGEKLIVDKGTKGMNLIEMRKWVKEFIDYAEPNDVLIMDNLSSHKNAEILKELENHIHVLFLPPRSADELSVLDNCFFAIYKKLWYKRLLFVSNVEEKERQAISLFNDLIRRKIGKKMYKHCNSYDIFKVPYNVENDDLQSIEEIIDEIEKDYQ